MEDYPLREVTQALRQGAPKIVAACTRAEFVAAALARLDAGGFRFYTSEDDDGES
jgi:hypothetical protein